MSVAHLTVVTLSAAFLGCVSAHAAPSEGSGLTHSGTDLAARADVICRVGQFLQR